MEIGLAILLFVCMTALLYVLLSLKITRQVDLQMKEFYKTRIHSDIQEFYREMEGYAALMENRIQRFKTLVERSEAATRYAAQPKESTVIAKPATIAPAGERKMTKRADRALSKEPPKQVAKQSKKQTGTPQKKTAAQKPEEKIVEKPLSSRRTSEKSGAPPQTKTATVPIAAPFVANKMRDSDEDTAIAAELVKDLFPQDEMQLSYKTSDATPVQQVSHVAQKNTPPADSSASAVMNLFSRIGKTFESAFVTPKPATPATPNLPENTSASQAKQIMKNPDFAEVLRRAEQIKAEKQAARERAELQARAEFYSAGDVFATSSARKITPSTSEEKTPATNAGGDVRNLADHTAKNRQVIPAARNTLAVKNLDEHTIRFLVDSLRHDAGYRRQALRALTENNIPLEEIARLSRIDIAELQLMQQLDKF